MPSQGNTGIGTFGRSLEHGISHRCGTMDHGRWSKADDERRETARRSRAAAGLRRAGARLAVLAACSSDGADVRAAADGHVRPPRPRRHHLVDRGHHHRRPTTSTTAAPAGRGVSSADVRAVQERLAELGYDVGEPDGRFGGRTSYAIMAFQKMEGLDRTGDIDDGLQAALAGRRSAGADGAGRARRPGWRSTSTARCSSSGAAARCTRILPISSGNGEEYCVDGECDIAVTPPGSFHIGRKAEGLEVAPLGELWWPMYFNGGIAIHGSPSVPPYPASHGCIRIPMYAAPTFYDQVGRGTAVILVGRGPGPEGVGRRRPSRRPTRCRRDPAAGDRPADPIPTLPPTTDAAGRPATTTTPTTVDDRPPPPRRRRSAARRRRRAPASPSAGARATTRLMRLNDGVGHDRRRPGDGSSRPGWPGPRPRAARAAMTMVWRLGRQVVGVGQAEEHRRPDDRPHRSRGASRSTAGAGPGRTAPPPGARPPPRSGTGPPAPAPLASSTRSCTGPDTSGWPRRGRRRRATPGTITSWAPTPTADAQGQVDPPERPSRSRW